MGGEMKDPWKGLLAEYEPLIGRYFKDRFDNTHKFFGLVHGRYDYYYGMYSIKHGTTCLLSCVGSLKTHGYELTEMYDHTYAN